MVASYFQLVQPNRIRRGLGSYSHFIVAGLDYDLLEPCTSRPAIQFAVRARGYPFMDNWDSQTKQKTLLIIETETRFESNVHEAVSELFCFLFSLACSSPFQQELGLVHRRGKLE
ncbi:hypothetical protein V6N12_070072 [Hibiscus sabdariffa]|uniref:Uncharacterized protein n=1 Tax=Hibiscus sabdariffa TaxID=183260 RepID=A0ABR2FFP4_9ROSI